MDATPKNKRFQMIMSVKLLAQVDAAATATGLSRSAFLRQAAIMRLEQLNPGTSFRAPLDVIGDDPEQGGAQ